MIKLASYILFFSFLAAFAQTGSGLQQPVTVAEPASATEPPGQTIRPFGYNLFSGHQTPASIIPAGGQLPPDYRLGPGDKLGIFLGGKTQEQFEIMVSVDGQVYIPTVGVLQVNGLSLDQFTRKLDKKLKKLYSDYDVSVMLLAPKTAVVDVMGEVSAPGQYPVSALSSVLAAVTLAGGVTENGSLRNVEIFHGDSVIAHIDLYDYILRPTAKTLHVMQSGYKIFVPVKRATVSITGEVNRPAIYELNPNIEESVCDLVELAGGFTDVALKTKVEQSRQESTGRTVYYLDLSSGCDSTTIPIRLKNGDRITVYSVLDQVPETVVTIHGEVKNPGPYPFEENMRVSDLILKAGNLTRSAFKLYAEVAKVQPDGSVRTVEVDLPAILEGTDPFADILLDPDSHLFIRRIPDWELDPIVQVQGEVVFPGAYAVQKDSTTLSRVLKNAGGFTQEALISEAKLVRRRSQVMPDKEFERLKLMSRDEMSDLEYEYFVMQQNLSDANEIVVDFYKLMVLGDRSEDVLLMPGDLIYVPKKPQVVYVSGRVSHPGGVVFRPGQNLGYYISKAGGFTWDANRRKTRVIKASGEMLDDEEVKSFEPGDRIWVPRKIERNYWQIARDVILVAGQMATIYLVVRNATRN